MDNELTLRVEQEHEVSLPVRVIDTNLSLADIGALVMITALADGKAGLDHPRLATPEVRSTMSALRERGIFAASFSDRALKLEIDLGPALEKQGGDDAH